MNIENLEGIVERIHFIRLGRLVLAISISHGHIIIILLGFTLIVWEPRGKGLIRGASRPGGP